ncbi:MAG TPA: DUF697 domain-containing protein [Stellaceae bacterium]|nr:DUF697 domain-containing protein [Stellaceae bacterium]
MTKTLPRLRNPTLDDIKRTATPVAVPLREPVTAPPADVPLPAAAVDPAPAERSGDDEKRFRAAHRLVVHYRRWTIAVATAPLPLVDAALVSSVQIRMLAQLARLYDVPFERVRVVSLLSALFGGWTPYTITTGFAGAAARMSPGLGTVIGIATSIGTSVLATETIGKMFVQHFEEGGTFLDFEPRKYQERLAKAKGERKTGAGGTP